MITALRSVKALSQTTRGGNEGGGIGGSQVSDTELLIFFVCTLGLFMAVIDLHHHHFLPEKRLKNPTPPPPPPPPE